MSGFYNRAKERKARHEGDAHYEAETRTIECPECEGKGGWEGKRSQHPDYEYRYGYGWTECPVCKGTGEVIEEIEECHP